MPRWARGSGCWWWREQAELRARIGKGLWELKESFLAHGHAGGADDARQPILLSDKVEAANGARFVALADGQWREEALGFERALLVFDEATIEAARGAWRKLDGDETLTRRYFKQEGGKWVAGRVNSCGAAFSRLGARRPIRKNQFSRKSPWRLPAPFRSSSPMPPAAT